MNEPVNSVLEDALGPKRVAGMGQPYVRSEQTEVEEPHIPYIRLVERQVEAVGTESGLVENH